MTKDDLAWRVDRVRQAFRAQFGGDPAIVVRAPGRVNLIGEHTDYNDGFVLPVAIDRNVLLAVEPRFDRRVQIHALDLDAQTIFVLNDIIPQKDWSDYPRGVAWALQARGVTPVGMNAVLTSNVPLGAGLSSSAAIEVAFAHAWQQLSGFALERTELALTCQQAENEFVGVNCGIMDQFISVLGRAGHALLIDCRTLAYELAPLPEKVSIVICDSMKRRGLVDSAYNERRRQCQEAVRLLQPYLPGINALRDVSPDDLARLAAKLPEVVRRRARHIVHENARVLAFAQALRCKALDRAGGLMNESHASLRDDYEVSCPELDALVEAAWSAPGVYGSRMTGAGFGGCTVSLVAGENVDAFCQHVRAVYEDQSGLEPQIYISQACEGVQVI